MFLLVVRVDLPPVSSVAINGAFLKETFIPILVVSAVALLIRRAIN